MEITTKDEYLAEKAAYLAKRVRNVRNNLAIDNEDRSRLALEVSVNTFYGMLLDMSYSDLVKKSSDIYIIEELIDLYEGNEGDWRTLLFEKYIYGKGLNL